MGAGIVYLPANWSFVRRRCHSVTTCTFPDAASCLRQHKRPRPVPLFRFFIAGLTASTLVFFYALQCPFLILSNLHHEVVNLLPPSLDPLLSLHSTSPSETDFALPRQKKKKTSQRLSDLTRFSLPRPFSFHDYYADIVQ